MFPAYPLLCLCAAVSVDAGQMLLFRTFINNGSHYLKSTARYAGILLVLFAVLGVSRILALYKGKLNNVVKFQIILYVYF